MQREMGNDPAHRSDSSAEHVIEEKSQVEVIPPWMVEVSASRERRLVLGALLLVVGVGFGVAVVTAIILYTTAEGVRDQAVQEAEEVTAARWDAVREDVDQNAKRVNAVGSRVVTLETGVAKLTTDLTEVDDRIRQTADTLMSDVAGRTDRLSARANQIEAELDRVAPIGTVIEFAGTAEHWPDGWLLCDGSRYLRDDYPKLYEALPAYLLPSESVFYVPNMTGRMADPSSVRGRPLGKLERTANYPTWHLIRAK